MATRPPTAGFRVSNTAFFLDSCSQAAKPFKLENQMFNKDAEEANQPVKPMTTCAMSA